MQKNIIQLHNVEPQQIINPLTELKKQIEDLKTHLQPKNPTEYLTRNEVAEMLKINLSTVHNWTRNKTLKAYSINARVYFKRDEVEKAIIHINK